MGGGYWDTTKYSGARALRSSMAKSKGLAEDALDFAYTASAEAQSGKIHPNLDPRRINNKPFGKLESRDSVDHPESNAVMVCFDVTGSNISRAREAQKRLPNLMDLLQKYLSDPQVGVAANDDYNVKGRMAFQISDYESDNRVDDHIRNVVLVGDGGGNMGESYDLMLYAAARKTVLDCMEQRNRKGYLFLYADEPLFGYVNKTQVKDVFDDDIPKNIPIETIIEEVRQNYHVFMIWPQNGYMNAREQFVKLFGENYVLTLQNPNLICELIASVIGINEERIGSKEAISDLIEVGATKEEASDIVSVAMKVRRKIKLEDTATGTEA